MKKILCPVDFSAVSDNAVEYAASLCRLLGARLELVNVQFADPVQVHDPRESKKLPAFRQLERTCRQVRKNFGIHCTCDIEVPNDDLASTIAAAAYDADLVVVGTSGMNELYEFFFGTYTYNVAKKITCPLLVVPSHFSYRPPKKTVVAWDYNVSAKEIITEPAGFKKAIGPEMVLLHISTHDTEASKDIFRITKEELEKIPGKKPVVCFERICSDDVAGCIDEYMTETGAGLLVLTMYKRGFFKKLFHEPVTKELIDRANYPILVFHTGK